MNICRNRLWTLGARLARPLDELYSHSIRINSVNAQKWHSIASTQPVGRNRLLCDGNRWPQLATASINKSLVVYMSSSRNVHSHKQKHDIKYEEKLDNKSETKAPIERSVEHRTTPEPKKPVEKDVAESSTPATASSSDDSLATDPEKKLGLFARFKLMSKQYWYVLLPVHVVTSTFWFGGLYYLSSSGVDIPALLETLNVSESVISKLRDSTMGHLAFAYMCYKILTPIRYTVTLGGTTVSIKYLSQWGYIRPMPSKEKLKQIYEDQKAKFKQKD